MSVLSENNVIRLVCPFCRGRLDSTKEYLRCNRCKGDYPFIDDIPSFITESEQRTIKFYEDWHKDPHKIYNLEGIGQPIKLNPFIRRYSFLFEKILYTQFQRERFFKRLSRKFGGTVNGVNVLDLGCGGGNPEFLNLGNIYGVDYCVTSIKHGIATEKYKMVANCNATALPFESEQFDCIVSSDFIGHIPSEEKERLFTEMSRVLKNGGICAHVIETDSENFVRRFAKKHNDLYKKYFIDGIGGHFGLELPTVVIDRFRKAGLEPILLKKYYSYIWDVESFIALFDNEYKDKSFSLRVILSLYKLLCKKFSIKLLTIFITGLFSWLVDMITPINTAEGIMIICEKRVV